LELIHQGHQLNILAKQKLLKPTTDTSDTNSKIQQASNDIQKTCQELRTLTNLPNLFYGNLDSTTHQVGDFVNTLTHRVSKQNLKQLQENLDQITKSEEAPQI
jgi:thiamine pyrophosphokinase